MANLPLIGVEAAILGVGAFQANAKNINGILASVGRSAKLTQGIFKSDKSGDIYATQQARIERAATRVARVQADVAAANDRASKTVVKQQQVAAAAVQTAAQRDVNAKALQSKAAQSLAAVQTTQAVSIQRAQDRVANSAKRLQVAQDLASSASSPSRTAAAARAAIAHSNAQQQLAATTQRTSAVINKAQASYAASQARAGAASQTAAAVQTAASSKVAAASSNAANVAVLGTKRVAAANLVLAQAQRSVSVAGSAMFAAFGVAAAAAAVAVVYAFANMTSSMLSASNVYQQQMQFIGSISGITGAELKELSTIQMQLARTTTSSAQNIALLSSELLKAGFSYAELKSGVLEQTNAMVIASKGELQYAQAATVLRATLSAFGNDLKGDATKAVNIITGAVQNSTLSFTTFLDGLKQGGSVIAASNTTLLDFATAAALASRVIPAGAEVGTALRNTFLRLQAPSKQAAAVMREYNISLYDANGSARGFRDVLVDLTNTFGRNADGSKKMADAEREKALAVLGGARVAKVLAAVIDQGIDEYDALRTKIEESSSAMQIADAIMRSNAGLMETFANNVRTLGLAIGEGLDPYLNAILQRFLEWIQSIDTTLNGSNKLGESIGKFLVNALFNLGDILGGFIIPTIVMLGEVVAACAMLWVDEFKIMGDAINAFYEWQRSVGEGIVKVFQFIGNGLQQLGEWIKEGLATQAQNFQAWVQSAGGSVNGVIDAFQSFISGLFQVGTGVENASAGIQQNFGGVVNGAVQMANGIINAFNGLTRAIGTIFSGIASQINIFLSSVAEIPGVAEVIGGVRSVVSNVSGAVGAAVGSAGVAIQRFSTGAATTLNRWAGAAGEALGNFSSTAVRTLNGAGAGIDAGLGRIGSTFGNFFDRVGSAVNKFRTTVKFPEFTDYASRISQRIAEAQKAATQGAGEGTEPDEYSEPGSLPGGGGDDGKAAKDAAKAAEDYAKAVAKAQELLRDFFDDVNNLWRDHSKAYNEAFAKAEAGMVEATKEATDEIAKITKEAVEELDTLNTSKAIERDAERRRKILEDTINYETQLREHAAEDAETIYERELEDLEAIEEKKRAAREKTFDREQERNAERRDEERNDQDRNYDKQLEAQQKTLDKQQELIEKGIDTRQSAEEDALTQRQDAIEAALEREQDAREEALRKQLEAEDEALKKSQEARLKVLNEQLDAEKRARAGQLALADIEREAGTGRETAQQEYQKEISIGVKGSIANQRRQDKLDAIAADEAEAKAKLQTTKETDAAELSFEQEQQARLDALQATFDAEDVARKAANEAATLALRLQTEAETAAMQAQFRAQDAALKLAHEQELDRIHEEHERARDDLSNRIERDRLDRQKQRAREDREFAERQEEAKQKYIEEENKRQLEETRKKEDELRERKRRQEAVAIAQRISDDDRRALLAENLDDEEFQRRVDQINNERDKRIETTNKTLEDQHTKITDALNQEIEDLETQLVEKITTIRTNYNDKLQDLVEDAGEQIRPIIDNIGEQMGLAFEGAKNQVAELVTTLADAIVKAGQAATAITNMPKPPAVGSGGSSGGGSSGGGGGKCDWWGIYNACRGGGGKDGDCKSKADRECPPERRASGGPVRAGGSYMVGEKGPEMFVPSGNGKIVPFGASHGGGCPECGGNHQHLASVRASEGMNPGTGGGSSQIVNNYSYSVEANYGRTQPVGSIRMDLSALVAMTRR